MSTNEKLTYHETMDTHELMNLKTIALLKSKLMQGMVFDQDLRALMEKNVQQTIKDIEELQNIYEHYKSDYVGDPMNDFLDPINSVGMAEQVDSSLAVDLLITVKEAVRNYSIALTESSNPEVRLVIRRQMELAIDFQDEVIDLMIEKKWFHPYDINEQKKIDMKAAQTAVEIAKLNLFPDNTNRKGMFPTPPN